MKHFALVLLLASIALANAQYYGNGANAINGLNGINRLIGPNGANGINGVNGVNGVNGRPWNYNNFQSQIIQDDEAFFPLCFPNGFPLGSYAYSCYWPQMFATSYRKSLPCLPPIVLGRPIPPCVGSYVQVVTYTGNLNNPPTP